MAPRLASVSTGMVLRSVWYAIHTCTMAPIKAKTPSQGLTTKTINKKIKAIGASKMAITAPDGINSLMVFKSLKDWMVPPAKRLRLASNAMLNNLFLNFWSNLSATCCKKSCLTNSSNSMTM